MELGGIFSVFSLCGYIVTTTPSLCSHSVIGFSPRTFRRKLRQMSFICKLSKKLIIELHMWILLHSSHLCASAVSERATGAQLNKNHLQHHRFRCDGESVCLNKDP